MLNFAAEIRNCSHNSFLIWQSKRWRILNILVANVTSRIEFNQKNCVEHTVLQKHVFPQGHVIYKMITSLQAA